MFQRSSFPSAELRQFSGNYFTLAHHVPFRLPSSSSFLVQKIFSRISWSSIRSILLLPKKITSTSFISEFCTISSKLFTRSSMCSHRLFTPWLLDSALQKKHGSLSRRSSGSHKSISATEYSVGG